MILVLNCMMEKNLATSFDKAILRPIEKSGKKAEFVRVTGPEKLPDPSLYSHVILSGSEASAINDMPWDNPLQEVIKQCVTLKKPFLGICYGHQFLAGTLADRKQVVKAVTPEFGWTNIHLLSNPLFEGLPQNHISMVSHFDMVQQLPAEFNIIASSRLCNIHAYQYRDLPIWGLQFHPEYNADEAKEIFDALHEEEPNFPSLYDASLLPMVNFAQNERILLNFLTIHG